MGPEKVELHAQAQLLPGHGAREVSRGMYNFAERREELGGSERRRLSLKQVGFESKRSRVTVKWSWVKRGRKTET